MIEDELEQVTEVVIMPARLLGDKTTKNMLIGLQRVGGIKGIIIQGPSYMSRKLNIDEQVIEPSVKVGKIFIEIEGGLGEGAIEEIMEGMKHVCSEFLPFGYDISVSTYRKKSTISDYIGKKAVKELGVLKREKEED